MNAFLYQTLNNKLLKKTKHGFVKFIRLVSTYKLYLKNYQRSNDITYDNRVMMKETIFKQWSYLTEL